MPDLTPKQREFCRQYLLDLNATQAAVRAGYSAVTAKEIGYENLTKPHIAAEIQRLMAERAERTALHADWVLARIRDEAEDRGEGSTQAGRLKALELLGKHLGLFKDKVEHCGPDGGPIMVLTPDQRAEAVAAILAQAAARLTSSPPE